MANNVYVICICSIALSVSRKESWQSLMMKMPDIALRQRGVIAWANIYVRSHYSDHNVVSAE